MEQVKSREVQQYIGLVLLFIRLLDLFDRGPVSSLLLLGFFVDLANVLQFLEIWSVLVPADVVLGIIPVLVGTEKEADCCRYNLRSV